MVASRSEVSGLRQRPTAEQVVLDPRHSGQGPVPVRGLPRADGPCEPCAWQAEMGRSTVTIEQRR